MSTSRASALAPVIPIRATVRTVALYLRISKDALRRGLGVARQENDCRELAGRLWPGAELVVYVDNDRSATRKDGKLPERPEYRRLLEEVEAGRVDAVVSWELDRLVRDPLEHEEFLLRAERAGMHRLVTLADEVDIQTGEGLMVARIKAAVAAEEVRKMSKRIRRKMDELAQAGHHGGGVRRFGYRYETTWTDEEGKERGSGALVVDEAEAGVIREAARRVLEGRSLGAYVRDLNADPEAPRPVRGGAWRQTTLRQTLMGAHVAGLRTHKGTVVGEAAWPAILARETWEAVRSVLSSPGRLPSGNRRTYLLTGLVVCGSCGAKMAGSSGGKRGAARYVCPGAGNGSCGAVSISAARLEELVVPTVFAATSSPELNAALEIEAEAGGRREELMAAVTAAEAHLTELGREFGRGELPRSVVLAAVGEAEAKLKVARDALAELERKAVRPLDRYVGQGLLEAAWPELTMDERRAVLREALEAIRVAPVGTSGGHANFDPRRVDLVWQHEELTAEAVIPEPAYSTATECSNCGASIVRAKGGRGGRCSACSTYLYRHGTERPAGMGKGRWARASAPETPAANLCLRFVQLSAFSSKVYAYTEDGTVYEARNDDPDLLACEFTAQVRPGDLKPLPASRVPVTLRRMLEERPKGA